MTNVLLAKTRDTTDHMRISEMGQPATEIPFKPGMTLDQWLAEAGIAPMDDQSVVVDGVRETDLTRPVDTSTIITVARNIQNG